MSTPLSHYVRYYDGMMPPQVVEELMSWFHRVDTPPIQRRTPLYSFEEREIHPLADNRLNLLMGSVVARSLQRYVTDCRIEQEQWPLNYEFEGFRMKRYRGEKGDKFDPHVDVTDRHTCPRFLVVMCYLSTRPTNCKGGSTTFADGTVIDPVACRVALFPPLWPWLHAGGSPEGWDKYTIQTYLRYAQR